MPWTTGPVGVDVGVEVEVEVEVEVVVEAETVGPSANAKEIAQSIANASKSPITNAGCLVRNKELISSPPA
jgi:hypothetical protein